jgi:hypothetical protein
MTRPSRELAKDVASELEHRRRRRKLTLFVLWIALIVAALLWLRCGRGWGTGGKDPGKGAGHVATATEKAEGPRRCTVRVSAEGITVDGKQQTRDEAVAACKQTEGALITVTGDARQGDWDELRTALEAAGVPVFKRN